MRFRLLGPLGAETDSGLIELGPPKQRSVLAVLLLHANEIVSTDRIVDLVWGEDPPRTAEHSVQIYISELRKSLSDGPSDLISTKPPGYVLNAEPGSIDIDRFERLVGDGLNSIRVGESEQGVTKLEAASELWGGTPFADFAHESFAQARIRSLNELKADDRQRRAWLCHHRREPRSMAGSAGNSCGAREIGGNRYTS